MPDAERPTKPKPTPMPAARAPRGALVLHTLAGGLYVLMAVGHTFGHLASEPAPTGEKAQMYALMRSVALDLPGGFTATMQELFDFASETMGLLWAFVGLLNLAAAPALARDAGALSRVTSVNLVAGLGLLALCVRTPAPPVVFYVLLVAMHIGTLLINAMRRR